MRKGSKPLRDDAVRYDRKIATVSAEEFAELMAIVHSEPTPVRPLTPDDQLRRDYQRDQQNKRVLGSQADLVSPRTITHYRRPRLRVWASLGISGTGFWTTGDGP